MREAIGSDPCHHRSHCHFCRGPVTPVAILKQNNKTPAPPNAQDYSSTIDRLGKSHASVHVHNINRLVDHDKVHMLRCKPTHPVRPHHGDELVQAILKLQKKDSHVQSTSASPALHTLHRAGGEAALRCRHPRPDLFLDFRTLPKETPLSKHKSTSVSHTHKTFPGCHGTDSTTCLLQSYPQPPPPTTTTKHAMALTQLLRKLCPHLPAIRLAVCKSVATLCLECQDSC